MCWRAFWMFPPNSFQLLSEIGWGRSCLWFCLKSQNLLTALSEGSFHFWILRQSILPRWHPIHIIPQKPLLRQVYRSVIWPDSLICKAAVSSRHLFSQEPRPWPVFAELMLPHPLACVSRQIFPPSCLSPVGYLTKGHLGDLCLWSERLSVVFWVMQLRVPGEEQKLY